MNNLPKEAFIVLLSTGEMVLVKRGEMGYFPQRAENMPWSADNVDILNERMGVTKAEAKAMQMGSMYGWDLPIADPNNYDENGRFIKK